MKDVESIIKVYSDSGSKRETARILGISKNTVKFWLAKTEDNPNIPLSELVQKKKVLIGHRSISNEVESKIYELLKGNQSKSKKLQWKSTAIHDKLLTLGFKVSQSSVDRIVRDWKKENEPKEVFIQQVPNIGSPCEFDWGHTPLKIGGIARNIPSASFVLRSSLYRFFLLYPKETLPFVIQSHIDFFDDIQRVPKEIVYDNLKTVVNNARTKEINEVFLRFSLNYCFSIRICNPSSPEEKGTDEESIGFVRNRIFSERDSFRDIDEANDYIRSKLRDINNSSVYRRDLTPLDALKKNVDKLNPLPSLRYDNFILETRCLNRYYQITFERNWYSVPEDYCSKVV